MRQLRREAEFSQSKLWWAKPNVLCKFCQQCYFSVGTVHFSIYTYLTSFTCNSFALPI
jgi:hypothetical protein